MFYLSDMVTKFSAIFFRKTLLNSSYILLEDVENFGWYLVNVYA